MKRFFEAFKQWLEMAHYWELEVPQFEMA